MDARTLRNIALAIAALAFAIANFIGAAPFAGEPGEEAARAATNAAAIPDSEPLAEPGVLRVIDGDTIDLAGERIRIENIDTPETGGRAECPYERTLAERATARARDLFDAAAEITVIRSGEDRYGRTLARIVLDGADVGETLVAENLAVEWAGRQHDWCADRP